MSLKGIAVGVALAAAAFCSTAASAATYGIHWVGIDGYTLEGQFQFSDSLLSSGAIDESNLDSLSFSVLLNGVSQGTMTFPPGGPVSFNFNTTTETFLIGGFPSGNSGQDWNYLQNPVGFGSGLYSQWVSVGGQRFGGIDIRNTDNSTLSAYRISPIPVPATLPLLAAGLGGLGLFARRRRRTD